MNKQIVQSNNQSKEEKKMIGKSKYPTQSIDLSKKKKKQLIYNIQDTEQEKFSIIQQQWKSIYRTKLNVDRMSVAPSISTWAL